MNVLTQSLLWVLLNLFFSDYRITLWIAEIFIWLLESFALSIIPVNQMNYRNALQLSLGMNLMSFGLGWFLPV